MTRADRAAAAVLTRSGASATGAALALATRVIAAVRPSPKPLHPEGRLVTGTLRRHGSPVPSGSSWVDEAGEDLVVARLSRAIGLPQALPDIYGLAVRVPSGASTGDLLFASTGWGRVGRYVLSFGGHVGARPMTTLLPYRTSQGAVLLGASATSPSTFELWWSRGSGPWHCFAELELSEGRDADPVVSFDPVRNRLPGLEQYPAVVRLREPAYLRARRSRTG